MCSTVVPCGKGGGALEGVSDAGTGSVSGEGMGSRVVLPACSRTRRAASVPCESSLGSAAGAVAGGVWRTQPPARLNAHARATFAVVPARLERALELTPEA